VVPDPVSGDPCVPAFQVDRRRGRVHPVVATVKAMLGATDDPWGVGSSWVSPHARLNTGQAPMDLIGTMPRSVCSSSASSPKAASERR
jgi:hypothetical protein